MRAETDEVEATDVAIVVLAIDFTDVAVTVGSHQHIELLPYRIHGCTPVSSVSCVVFLSLGWVCVVIE